MNIHACLESGEGPVKLCYDLILHPAVGEKSVKNTLESVYSGVEFSPVLQFKIVKKCKSAVV
jgi:hypothetical protein